MTRVLNLDIIWNGIVWIRAKTWFILLKVTFGFIEAIYIKISTKFNIFMYFKF